MSLVSDILARIQPGESRLAVVDNRDGFLLRHAQGLCAAAQRPLKICTGGSLDLRIIVEADLADNPGCDFVFVPSCDFVMLDDVAAKVRRLTLDVRRLFVRYHWPTVSTLTLDELEWLYSCRQPVTLSEEATRRLVADYHKTPGFRQHVIGRHTAMWDAVVDEADFRKPGDWMPSVASLVLDAVEANCLDGLYSRIEAFNNRFQSFLAGGYQEIVHSLPGLRPPRIVTHVAQYIARRNDERAALIVVDGMNFWQSVMLTRKLSESIAGVVIDHGAMLSWLPSVTELSRQAIFKGGDPSWHYVQNPANEQKLWHRFWADRHVPAVNVGYQHSGRPAPGASVTRFGYVNTELDAMMHASADYMYLYDDTRRWLASSGIVGDIERLLSDGYKLCVTSDHGNVEGVPYRALAQADKAGAKADLRYVCLPSMADREKFEREYAGHVARPDWSDRVYYAVGREIFSSRHDIVTHGGTHFLEVVIPFITIAKE